MLINCLLSSATIALLGVPFAARKSNRRNFWRHYSPWLYASAFAVAIYAAYIATVCIILLLADAAEM